VVTVHDSFAVTKENPLVPNDTHPHSANSVWFPEAGTLHSVLTICAVLLDSSNWAVVRAGVAEHSSWSITELVRSVVLNKKNPLGLPYPELNCIQVEPGSLPARLS